MRLPGKLFFSIGTGLAITGLRTKRVSVARDRELDICNQTSKPEDAQKKKKTNN
jgi:hypothetical protein